MLCFSGSPNLEVLLEYAQFYDQLFGTFSLNHKMSPHEVTLQNTQKQLYSTVIIAEKEEHTC